MDALAGYGSDSSSSSSEAQPPTASPPPKKKEDADPPAKKKSRWDKPSEKDEDGILPKPPLSSGKSMIEWEVDYLSNHPPQDKEVKILESSRTFLEERLKQSTQNINNSKALGKQLKEGHDFHNPRYLDNAAAACGISNILGSNLPNQETFEEYEFNLLALEEKARTKIYAQIEEHHALDQHQQHQQASSYANNQLERAMKQQCHR